MEIRGISNFIKTSNWTFNSLGEVDVHEDVNLTSRDIKTLPFKFGKINGDFDIPYNKLRTLFNAPNEVIGRFNAGYNSLHTLKGMPKIIKGNAVFAHNPLKSLKHIGIAELGYSFSGCYFLTDIEDLNTSKVNLNDTPYNDIYGLICDNFELFKDMKVTIGNDFYLERFKNFLSLINATNFEFSINKLNII